MQNNIGNGLANYTYITGAATTVIGTGGHIRLHSIVINKATTGTIKIIDALAGASTTANVGTIAALNSCTVFDLQYCDWCWSYTHQLGNGRHHGSLAAKLIFNNHVHIFSIQCFHRFGGDITRNQHKSNL